MAAQIHQAKTADGPFCLHCSSRGLRTLYGISRICPRYFSYFVCCVRNRRVLSGGRGALCSGPGLVGASMLRCSLDCMFDCLLVGRQLFTRFTFQYGGASRDSVPLLCGSLRSSQDKGRHLRILKIVGNSRIFCMEERY